MLTSSWVDITVANNGTWNDAFTFGTAGDTTWSFTGQSFKLEAKASNNDLLPLLTISTALGSIVVDNVVTRVLHLNVPEAALQAALPVGQYVYDLVMFDASVPPVRVPLMQGRLFIQQGVTED